MQLQTKTVRRSSRPQTIRPPRMTLPLFSRQIRRIQRAGGTADADDRAACLVLPRFVRRHVDSARFGLARVAESLGEQL